MHYFKLVRDKVPEQLRAQGKKPVVSTLSTPHYRLALCKKLVEEAEDVVDGGGACTLENILELVECLAKEYGYSMRSLRQNVKARREEAGGYAGRTYLEKVDG